MISHNCNQFTLLGNSDIIITKNENDYYFHIPTLSELFTSKYDSNFFMGFMSMTEEDFYKATGEKLDYIRYIRESMVLSDSSQQESLLYFLQICCKNELKLVDDWLVLNDKILDNQIFNLFVLCYRVGMGDLSLKDFKEKVANLSVKKTEEELEWDRKRKLAEARISKAKASVEKNKLNIEDILSVISSEFNRSFKELLDCNFYTIYSMYRSSLKIDAHRVSLIGLGNGLTKTSYKHWVSQK